MATQQLINNTRVTGPRTFFFTGTPAGATNALITIDRTVNNGLNSLPLGSTLDITIDRSIDGGTTWTDPRGITCQGGTLVTKGITQTSETLGVGIPQPNTQFRITLNPSQAVTIAGTVDYTP
jgi:hypothetical protein